MFQPRCFKSESIFSILLCRSIRSFNIPSLPPPLPRHAPGILTFWRWVLSNCYTHRAKTVSKCFAQLPDFMAFFFLTRGRINNRDFLVNLFFWANCYFVVLFTSMKVVLLDANDLSNNHHLSHDNDQSSLSHQRWFAAHIRPSNQYAGALTVDRCLLAVIVLGRREDNGNYSTYWLLIELHIIVFFVKLWSRK